MNTTGARCLDGSPGGLYFSKGYGDGANKTIVFFDGGGWCYGQDTESVAKDCYYRSKTALGSTDPNVTDKFINDVWDAPDWFASGNKDEDINYSNWNRFFFIYCDGTGHQGYI